MMNMNIFKTMPAKAQAIVEDMTPRKTVTPASVEMWEKVYSYFYHISGAHMSATLCELTPGELSFVVLSRPDSVTVYSNTVSLDKKSPSLGGGLHLRGNAGNFRRALYKSFPDQDFKSFPVCNTVDFMDMYETWRAGRSRAGYNVGNFTEFIFAWFMGEDNHAHHNTLPGCDVQFKKWDIEVKALFGKCRCQMEFIDE